MTKLALEGQSLIMIKNHTLTPMFDQEYAKLALNQPTKDRFDLGKAGVIVPIASGKVMKYERISQFRLESEYKTMLSLWEAGFRAMPKPISCDPKKDTIIMEEIHHGIPLEEVLSLYKEGEVSESLLENLFDILSDVLNDFWATGAAHGDLNLRNILVGKNSEAKWCVWLIDFQSTSWIESQTNDVQQIKGDLNRRFGLDPF